jgi:hypothetical protein
MPSPCTTPADTRSGAAERPGKAKQELNVRFHPLLLIHTMKNAQEARRRRLASAANYPEARGSTDKRLLVLSAWNELRASFLT